MKAALEQIGFEHCHHMSSLRLDPGLLDAWTAVARGGPADWRAIFSGYGSVVDWPALAYWRELVDQYPEAKVVLTVRDPDEWYASARETIYRYTAPQRGREGAVAWLENRLSPFLRQRREICRRLIWDGMFDGRFEDRDHAISVFNAHNAAVQREISPERLLVFDVAQGWGPLCGFLQADVPREPFPHYNLAATFQQAQQLRSPVRRVMARESVRS